MVLVPPITPIEIALGDDDQVAIAHRAAAAQLVHRPRDSASRDRDVVISKLTG